MKEIVAIYKAKQFKQVKERLQPIVNKIEKGSK